MAVALASSPTITDYPAAQATSASVTRTCAVGSQLLLIVTSHAGSVATALGVTVQAVRDNGSPRLRWEQTASTVSGGYVQQVWQGGPATVGGDITVSVTMTGKAYVGLALLELTGAPWNPWRTAEIAAAGRSTTAAAAGLTVANSGSLALIASNHTNIETADPSSPWTTNAGPLMLGEQYSGFAYQVVGSDTSSAAWSTTVSGPWSTLGVVVPALVTGVDPGDIDDGILDNLVTQLDRFGCDGFRRSYVLSDDWLLKVARDREVNGVWPGTGQSGAGILANQREIIRATAVGTVLAAEFFSQSVNSRWVAMERPVSVGGDRSAFSAYRYIVNPRQVATMGDSRVAMIDLGTGPLNAL